MNRISGPKKDKTVNHQLYLWFRVDSQLGAGIAIDP